MSAAAISLSYDDGLNVHHELVATLLHKYGIRATFYPFMMSEIRNNGDAWKSVAKLGHELGNHTLFHPCRQNCPDYHYWLDDRYDLRTYTLAHFKAELEIANFILHLIDGKTERTFGNTCCHLTVGPEGKEESMTPVLKELFIAARGEIRYPDEQQEIDPFNVGCVDGDGKSLNTLKELSETAIQGNTWLIFMFHGVGEGTHDLYVDEAVHRQFIQWLASRNDVTVDTVLNIARTLSEDV